MGLSFPPKKITLRLDPAQALNLVSEPVVYGVYDKVINDEEKEEEQEAVEPLDTDLEDERSEEQEIALNSTDPTQPILAANLEGVHDENPTLHTLHTLHDSTLKVGDKVEYIGTDESLVKQYAGILTVHSLQYDSCSCMKSGGEGLTSWIEFVELRLVGG